MGGGGGGPAGLGVGVGGGGGRAMPSIGLRHPSSGTKVPESDARPDWGGRDGDKLQALVYDILQPLPYLVTPEGPENCQLTNSFSLVLKQ